MICGKCGKEMEHAISLGEGFAKNGEPMLKVCERCRDDWIRFLDRELAKLIKQKNLSQFTLYSDLEGNVKDKLWLASFRKWYPMEFVFR